MVEQKKLKQNLLGILAKGCSTIIFITVSFLHISFFFSIVPHISLTFNSFPSKEHSVGMSVKGKAFGVYSFFQLAAAHFDF